MEELGLTKAAAELPAFDLTVELEQGEGESSSESGASERPRINQEVVCYHERLGFTPAQQPGSPGGRAERKGRIDC